MVYDRLGRQFKQYLPFANSLVGFSSSNYREHNNLITSINSVYLGKYPDDISSSDLNPYSETFYEPSSPLNRVSEQAAPGTVWKGNPAADTDHTVKYAYETNVTNEVRSFKVNFVNGNTENTELALSGHYLANRLYKSVVKDENWQPGDGKNKTTEEFKDKQGNVILKRTYNQGLPHDTYYVYDVYGNLTYVIPPLASDDIVIESRTITPIGVNYPWTLLSRVDQSLAEAYGRELEAYQNEEILNLDLLDKYGGQGGFSVIPDENGNLVVNINITTAAPMEYRMGPIVDLKPLGSYADSEVGRIKGTGYDYMFIIRNGKLEVIGAGKVPSMNLSFTASPLEYSQNYPWTKLCQADPNIVKNYETAISGLDNSQILTTYTPNPYGAMGGISVSLDEFDTLTLSVNITTDTALELVSGTAFPLDIERSIADRNLGVIDGDLNGVPFHYELSIRGNSLYINGSGKFMHLNHFSSQLSKSFYDIRETAIDGLCYIYHYDKRNRIIEKHIPGKGWEHIVYDRLDRPVLTQDENLRHDNNWLFTKYEMYGRVA
ncbi:MAG TPA: DUF6443 domain-containing protein, partial [Flavobacterium sp.]|nr:DUF6443 domain-containing protein [Flavobacterium sp.]